MAETPPKGQPRLWTVDQLKQYLCDQHLPTTGIKAELVERMEDCIDAIFLEEELELNLSKIFMMIKQWYPNMIRYHK